MAVLLIVEDDTATNEAICEYMRSAGHITLSALDGEQGLQIAREKYLVYSVVNVDAPGIVVPFVFDGQTHAVKQHPIEQLGVRGKVLKAGVGDKLAGDAEVGKLHRLVAVKIARKFHIRHGRCLLLGMKKTRLSNRVFFWMFDFVTKERI